ncbi:hypothetical protein HGG82_00525 [Marinomonas sp. M1K-6]|uniref:Uncharacterized protein n=1 Tax=Marinomonas profundi TaxID=2726122 RepID=A0A847QZ75_9GAMM|nr:hypothetical protein [Marinomonas profundi]NLQ16105.1 hypothetical protein [Marinomonas profundi]UDV03309.1 hypothetical protein J8N69_00475 [Marinomonas profundi]
MGLFDQQTLYPISHSIGSISQRIIIHQQDDLFIAHEHLYQSDTPTRFYQHYADTFLFVIKGELYLQQDAAKETKETLLKAQQGIWLTATSINTMTLLSAMVELCLLHLSVTKQPENALPFNRVSTGTVERIEGKNRVRSWPLWQGQSGSVAIQTYPPHYTEALCYQQDVTQYLLPLNGRVLLSDHNGVNQECSKQGEIIFKKTPRAILNPNSKSITLLTVTTPHPIKGRVLLLKNPIKK